MTSLLGYPPIVTGTPLISEGYRRKKEGRNQGRHEEVWEVGVNRGVQLAEKCAHLSFTLEELFHCFSTLSSFCTYCTCGSAAAWNWMCQMLDLHTAAVHLDDLGSEGLDGSQYQLLVLQGSDAKAQYISGDTDQDLPRLVGRLWNLLECLSLAGVSDLYFILMITVLKSNYKLC